LYRQVIETGEPIVEHEIRGTTPSDPGNQRCWLASYDPLKSADGTVVGLCTVVQDITARMRAERALRKTKERMQRLVESTGVVPCESDAERTQFRYVGPQAAKLLGQPLEHWYRRDFWVSHIHPDDRERVLRCFENCRTSRAASCECEYRMVAADGHPVWVRDILSLEFADRVPRSIRAFLIDVTEQRQMEQAVQVSEERLRYALDATSEAVWDWNIETDEVFFSPRWFTSLGYDPGELPHQMSTWQVRVHPEDWPRVREVLDRHFEGETPIYTCENRLRTKSGAWRWNLARGKVVARDEQGRPLRMVGVDVDISERKRIEEELARHRHHLEELVATRTAELEHSYRKLRHAERLASIGTFAAGIAHQINNPVGGILLAAQYAATAQDDPAAIDGALEDIVADTRRCGQIVRNLLRFAQEDTTDKVPRDLNGFVRACATYLARRIEEAGAELELGLDPGLPPVSLNETAMGEVLSNLLQNSLEAGAKHIALRTRAGQASARLVVEDDGRGVAPEDKHHVFDPFFSRRQGRGGTGLGLSIGHGIVADHGGTIELESEPGHGTTVTIELPRAGNEGGQDPHR
jgi:PAS domain S-box-containing protein